MTDEYDKTPPDAVRPDRPPAGKGPAPENGIATRAGGPESAPPAGRDALAAGPPPAGGTAVRPTPAVHLTQGGFVRWLLGLLLILATGWGLIALVGFLASAWKVSISYGGAAAVASVFSLGLFLLLERDLWLSRFMGLRLGPRSSPALEAVFLWLLGPVALLLRSTVAHEPTPQAVPATATALSDKAKRAVPESQDGFREIVETIVFVVVLVLLLKAFLAEAFVIPTGSMATTLLGYHRDATCPQCGYPFRVNMSNQLDPDRRSRPELVTGCTCPNCFLPFSLPVPEVRHP